MIGWTSDYSRAPRFGTVTAEVLPPDGGMEVSEEENGVRIILIHNSIPDWVKIQGVQVRVTDVVLNPSACPSCQKPLPASGRALVCGDPEGTSRSCYVIECPHEARYVVCRDSEPETPPVVSDPVLPRDSG